MFLLALITPSSYNTKTVEHSQKILITKKRSIGYREAGSPEGSPLFLFPGSPNSRFLPLPEKKGWEKDIRLIIPERPGFGLSDYQPGRKLLDWPRDVRIVADTLGIDKFAVLGLSAGGPYALACAYAIPDRITKTGIACSVGPMDIPGAMEELPKIRQIGMWVARYLPWLLRPLLWCISNPRHNPEDFFKKMISGNSDIDRKILMEPEMKNRLMRHYLEANRQGMRGFAREGIILSRSWRFSLANIRGPVFIWHGEEDHNVSLTAVRYMEKEIPHCTARYYPGQGHWLFHHYWREMIRTLVQ